MTSANLSTDLSGKLALVTGGASGIGLATATLLARCGATVAINHLPDDPRAIAEIERLTADGLKVIAAPGSVSEEDTVYAMVRTAIDDLGGLDILINNAGTPGGTKPIEFTDLDAMTSEFWNNILSTNLLGPYRCSHAAADALKAGDGGAIVSTASIAGINSVGSSIAYGASKAGLINMTRNLARALSPKVRVNAVAPGLVRSPWTENWPEERKKTSIEATLLKRYVETDDIAQTMLFLATHPAITAEIIVVDAGRDL